jgi:MFS family permease
MAGIKSSNHEKKWRFPHLPGNVIALGLVSFFNDASSEIIYPLLPLFLTSTLGAGMRFIGLIEGITESASSLLKLPAGWLSDRVGKRKWLVVLGYCMASVPRPLLALANAGWQVLGLRFIDRIGKGIRSAPRDALIADSVSAGRRGLAFGFHRAMDHLGALFGSIAAAWLIGLFEGDFRSVFWAAAIPAFMALLVLIFAVRDTRAGEREKNIQSTSSPLFRSLPPPLPRSPAPPLSVLDRNFKTYLAVLLLFTLGNSSDAFLLLRAQQVGMSVVMIPVLWAVLHLSKSLSSIIGGGLSDLFGRKRLIATGWIVYAVIYLGFAVAGAQYQMWLIFIFYGVYFGLTEGAEKALVTDLVSPHTRGTAFGMYNLIIGLGALPANLLMGFLLDRFSAMTALVTGASLSLLAAVLLMTLIRESVDKG